MINHNRSMSLPVLGLAAALVSVLAFQTLGGGGPTVILKPAVVATVDLERLFEAIPQNATAKQGLEAFGKSLDDQAAGMLEEIDVMQADLEGLPPGSARYQELNAELLQKSYELDGFSQFANSRLELEKATALKTIYTAIRDASASLAATNGYDLVMVDDTVGELVGNTEVDMRNQISGRRMLYGAKVIDITDLLIEAMNRGQ